MYSTVTSKGQITIPIAMRRRLGLDTGAAVEFFDSGDHLGLRPAQSARSLPESGFGLIKSGKPAVPADFDAASLLKKSSTSRKRTAK